MKHSTTMAKFFRSALIASVVVTAFLSRADAGSTNDVRRWTNIEKIQNAINKPSTPGSTVELPTVNVKGAEVKGYAVSPRDVAATKALNQRELKMLAQKKVELKRREISSLDAPVRSMPKVNFTAKQAALSDAVRPESHDRRTMEEAPVTKRRIVVNSPEGLEELKKQLNRSP